MDATFSLIWNKSGEIVQIIFRNVFILINLIIISVVTLLIFFGNTTEGLFLGFIVVLNTVIAIFQDIRSWVVLEKLNLLTVMYSIRINKDKTESRVLPEEILKDDTIKLKLGDQVPCDGTITLSNGLELNNALITGESNSFAKSIGDEVLAGSIVTTGSGLMLSKTTFKDSHIALMTVKIKRYSKKSSTIQESINKVVKYSGFILIVIIILVLFRGLAVQDTALSIVESIGALASVLVPQGLVIAVTLLFAYGASHLYKRHVLLQEMNAVEKMGHIKNLCMDKTGTLTENIPMVEDVHIPIGISRQEVETLTSAYLTLSGDSSETILAIKKFINVEYKGEEIQTLPFSSSRQYGGIILKVENENKIIFLGAPEVFMPHLTKSEEKLWLEDLIKTHAPQGKRIVCLVRDMGESKLNEITGSGFVILGVFILQHNIREGVREAINFFQDRDVHIRIISGDNPETVQAISRLSGINNIESVIIGSEMEKWTKDDFKEKAKQYTIFARIKPEQKEDIIEALKIDGFTAMVGDGANDALAIKTADLGIAMFDGAPATRKLASIVLTRNSFSELPGGVRLADSMIENVEIYSSMFFNQTFLGFFLLVLVSILGYSYPLTPLNITFINYFTIGIPSLLIFYWTINPYRKINPIKVGSFLKRVMFFPFISSIVQSFGAITAFIVSLAYFNNNKSNTSIVFAFIMSGYIYFLLTPKVYAGNISKMQKTQFAFLAVLELFIIYFAFKIPFVSTFFNISSITPTNIVVIAFISFVCGVAQFAIAKKFINKV